MSQIRITHNHTSPSDKIQAEIVKLVDKLKERYGGEYRHQENGVSFSRSGIEAEICYTTTQLTVNVRLGLMMAAFKGMIEAEIRDYLHKNVA